MTHSDFMAAYRIQTTGLVMQRLVQPPSSTSNASAHDLDERLGKQVIVPVPLQAFSIMVDGIPDQNRKAARGTMFTLMLQNSAILATALSYILLVYECAGWLARSSMGPCPELGTISVYLVAMFVPCILLTFRKWWISQSDRDDASQINSW